MIGNLSSCFSILDKIYPIKPVTGSWFSLLSPVESLFFSFNDSEGFAVPCSGSMILLSLCKETLLPSPDFVQLSRAFSKRRYESCCWSLVRLANTLLVPKTSSPLASPALKTRCLSPSSYSHQILSATWDTSSLNGVPRPSQDGDMACVSMRVQRGNSEIQSNL